jgi:hypothetical protein
MAAMMNVNPGMESRFKHKFHFDKWKVDTCRDLFVKLAADEKPLPFGLDQSAENELVSCLQTLSLHPKFSNARTVTNVFSGSVRMHPIMSRFPCNSVS